MAGLGIVEMSVVRFLKQPITQVCKIIFNTITQYCVTICNITNFTLLLQF